jgi:hypothetical protein
MAYSMTEETIKTLKAFILANYNTYLTQITTEKADDIPLPMIETQNISTGFIDLDSQKKWPYLAIIPVAEDWDMLSTGTDQVESGIQITIVIGGYRQSYLADMILRYGAAMRNMLSSNYQLGVADHALEVSPTMSVVYFQDVQGQADLKAVRLTIVIKKDIV